MNKLAWLGLAMIVACGGTNGGDDGGTDASNSDATSNDASTTDSSTKDSSTGDSSASDSSTSDASDGGGLQSGDPCNPQNDLCGAGLKCCAGGAIQLDGGKTYQCTTATDAGTCPLVP